MLVLRMILVTREAGVVELELLQSQQIKTIHGKCMLRCRTIPLIGEAGVVEVEWLQSQQIKIIHGKCMLRCRTILLVGEALLGMLEMELEDQMPSLMQDPVGVRKIRWSLMSI